MILKRAIAVLLLAVLTALSSSVSGQTEARTAANVILITIDTLRFDYVGSYGIRPGLTPALDRLAADGVRFQYAYCQAPMTPPSHASILTGTYPATHGLRDFASGTMRDDLPTLATILRERGYQTAAFVSAFVLDRSWGFARGFQTYFDQFAPEAFEGRNPGNVQRRAEETVDRALQWLARARPPYLIWLHLFDPHHDYDPPQPYRDRHREDLYAGEVAYTDDQIGRLLEALRQRGEYESSLIIATSDHGEALGSHQEQEHGFFVYEDVVRIPLIFKLPSNYPVPARQSNLIAQTVDILPTALQVVRGPDGIPAAVEGRGLLSFMLGKRKDPGFAYGETLYPQTTFGWSPLRFFREGAYKYIEAPKPELYRLDRDPGERENLADDNRAMSGRLRGRMLEFEARFADPPAGDSVDETDPERVQRLAALGYVAVSQPRGSSNLSELEDPKEKIGTYNRILESLQSAEAGRLRRSNQVLEEVLKDEPDLFIAYHQKGTNLLRLQQPQQALLAFEKARELNPNFPSTNLGTAQALSALGRTDDAIALLEGMDSGGESGLASRKLLALLYSRKGRHSEAIRIYTGILEERPNDFQSIKFLGIAQVQNREYSEGLAQLDEALRVGAEDALIQNNRGIALNNLGRAEESVEAYRRAIEINPRYALPYLNLAMALWGSGRRDEALKEFEKLCELNTALCQQYRSRFQ